MFPNSSDIAPDWVCDAPVEGYGVTVVGSAPISISGQASSDDKLPPYQSALLNAIVQFAQRMKVQVQNMIRQYAETTGNGQQEVDKVNMSVEKRITSEKFGNVNCRKYH